MPAPESSAYRVHHYGQLVRRWRAVARSSGLRLQRFAFAGEDPLLVLRSPALAAEGGIYISAGIHGDEPAAPEALIAWAERNAARLARWPLLIFPCLNPWGLRNNIRLDAAGLDLNRAFHLDSEPLIAALKKVVAPYRFELALMMHEDYDGEGFYLYEIKRRLPFWGEDVLAVAARKIAIDPRRSIDGQRASGGLIRRRFDRELFQRIGYPEAIWLHEFHAERALTTETPSEFGLEQRVRAHVAVLEACVQRVVRGNVAEPARSAHHRRP